MRDMMRSRTIEILPTVDEQAIRILANLGSRVATMERDGISIYERNEYVFDRLKAMESRALTEGIADGALRGVKKYIADATISSFGVKDGFFKDILTNFIAGLTMGDIQSMFQSDTCGKVASKLAGAIQGALVDLVLKNFGLDPKGFFAVTVVEIIKSGFVENGPFVKKTAEFICKMNISDMLPGGIASMLGIKKKSVSGPTADNPADVSGAQPAAPAAQAAATKKA